MLHPSLSDTHIGFNKDANPDEKGTLTRTIDLVNEVAEQPALIIQRSAARSLRAVPPVGRRRGVRRFLPRQQVGWSSAVGQKSAGWP